MRNLFFFVCGMIFLLSCEDVVGGDGKVISAKERKPIEGVEVVLYLNNNPRDTSFSDQKGRFYGSRFVGCVPRCPEAKLEFIKQGFKTKILVFVETPDFKTKVIAFNKASGEKSGYVSHSNFFYFKDSLVVLLERLKN